MEQTAQVNRQPVCWDSLEKDKFHLQENFLSNGSRPACIRHPQPAR